MAYVEGEGDQGRDEMNRYTITDEKTGDIYDYMHKKSAARKVRELIREGRHLTAQIYNENGVRIDGGSASAIRAILGR